MPLKSDGIYLIGILNLTPDSFYDGGTFMDPPVAAKKIENLLQAGADIIDIGAESTFGATSQVSTEAEWARLEPVLESIDLSRVVVSIDTYKSKIARKSLELGVQMINDVTALRGDNKMIETLCEFEPYVCLMFSANDSPYADRKNHQYNDVMETISGFLKKKTELLIQSGFPREKIIIDPGLGFFLSSDPKVSWEVIERLSELKDLGFPILIGPSMKSFLGGKISSRLNNTLKASRRCLENGASFLRVHHVQEHRNLVEGL